jgi:RND family efflux transporter MFP subunit
MRKPMLLSAVVVCVVGLAVIAWHHFFSVSAVNASVNDSKLPVKVSTVTLHTVPRRMNAVGVVVAPETVVLRAQQSGVIKKVLYKPGMQVKKGQLLVEQDATQQRADVMSAQSHYRETQSQYARLKKTDVLFPGSESQKDLQSAQDDMQMALAVVQKKQEALAQTSLRAPLSGRVQLVTQDSSGSQHNPITNWVAGAYLSSGESVVAVVGDNHTTVEYAVPVNMRDVIRLGQQVQVHAIDENNKTGVGQVSYIAPSADVGNQTILVMADLTSRTQWQPGLKIRVTQILDPNRKVLTIPGISVVTELGGYAIYTVEKNKVVMKPITIGDRFATWVQVDSGLKEGDSIIVQGMQAIHPGSLVKVVNS